MPKSLARGDYSLVLAVESSSRSGSWYRVLTDRHSGQLSCDCPAWTFKHRQNDTGQRSCPHTRVAERLVGAGEATVSGHAPQMTVSPLLTATQSQWPGLRGAWDIEQRNALLETKPYQFVLLRLGLGNGGTATGVVAFAAQHHHSERDMISGVAGWAGYAIAAEVARLGGFPLVGQPPEHFRIDRRPTTGRRQGPATVIVPSLGLVDILRVGDMVRPGTNPAEVAEQTLAYFLGQETYALLEQQGFLDIPSVRYAAEQRVYRLRRDPARQRDRRIRVFVRGVYYRDYCIVAGQHCPSDDTFLTVMLGLLSDEDATLSVVNPRYNIFQPYSDGPEQEYIPAVWRPRTTVLA